MSRYELISLLASILASVFSGYTFFVNRKYKKIELTINEYIGLQDFLSLLSEYTSEQIELFVDKGQNVEYKALSASLARLEIFALGVEKGLYDFNAFYDIAHGFLDGAIRDQIDALLDKKTNSEEYYANIYKLLERMDERAIKKVESE